MALDFSGQRDGGRDRIPEPVDAEVRILSWRNESTPEEKPSRFDEYIVVAQVPPVIPDPIRVRGIGSTTLFGLSSRFEDEFPSSLTGKYAVWYDWGVNTDIRLPACGLSSYSTGLRARARESYIRIDPDWVAVEEYQSTINRLNEIVSKSIPLNLKCLLVGCLCCCCTLGLSFTAAFYLNKRTRSRIDKLLELENWRLYNKLGLNLRLHSEQNSNNLREHILLIDFLPRAQLFHPD